MSHFRTGIAMAPNRVFYKKATEFATWWLSLLISFYNKLFIINI
jgi:hypothetical protein